ncbi:Tim10/DDP family zinc finger-domain-containing protein [Neohortaea acidophila]|uniref:Mitochondrial import inner membrane translocase subunit n=1 Tax=Neohortaea acidophila TaxID=245834 RepID=A0A6A6PX40_9PEZI|nr:Tim10/DDP family zinc finger-domain-containing protein [Neohortaea acidophila]KAF2484585.1 Tim10/DDP family zinc finger-domain-containing protein [Neohortaea acidophila]
MDNALGSLSPESLQSLEKLSPREKQELGQMAMQEVQKVQIQQTIHSLTDMCFKKCITSRISSGKLDRSEEPCMQNCVDRYMDANMTVIRHLEQLRQGS